MLGIIGGTGLYNLEGLTVSESKELPTPYGRPSAPVTLGKFHGHEICFLPRHGKVHDLMPGEINSRANIWALKASGALTILSFSAAASLNERLKPGDMGLVTQYFDWTKGTRSSSFFGEGIVAHVSMAEPSCSLLQAHVAECARTAEVVLTDNLTYGCTEGPRFGTKTESFFLRGVGCDLVGMTNLPEAFLAKEAQLAYVTLAIVTDYDCWQEDVKKHASDAQASAFYQLNLGKILRLLKAIVAKPFDVSKSHARTALRAALVTPESALRPKHRELLAFLRK